jgi:DNA-binding transcriptional regulator YiaG
VGRRVIPCRGDFAAKSPPARGLAHAAAASLLAPAPRAAAGKPKGRVKAADLRDMREKLGLSQVEFAYVAGVHPITVSKWERGKSVPTRYQSALFDQFRRASRDKVVCTHLRKILTMAGAVFALSLLLRHVVKKADGWLWPKARRCP